VPRTDAERTEVVYGTDSGVVGKMLLSAKAIRPEWAMPNVGNLGGVTALATADLNKKVRGTPPATPHDHPTHPAAVPVAANMRCRSIEYPFGAMWLPCPRCMSNVGALGGGAGERRCDCRTRRRTRAGSPRASPCRTVVILPRVSIRREPQRIRCAFVEALVDVSLIVHRQSDNCPWTIKYKCLPP